MGVGGAWLGKKASSTGGAEEVPSIGGGILKHHRRRVPRMAATHDGKSGELFMVMKRGGGGAWKGPRDGRVKSEAAQPDE
jgi:hypothetical protein